MKRALHRRSAHHRHRRSPPRRRTPYTAGADRAKGRRSDRCKPSPRHASSRPRARPRLNPPVPWLSQAALKRKSNRRREPHRGAGLFRAETDPHTITSQWNFSSRARSPPASAVPSASPGAATLDRTLRSILYRTPPCATMQKRGSPPIAAISLKLRASALSPIAAAFCARVKCTPSII